MGGGGSGVGGLLRLMGDGGMMGFSGGGLGRWDGVGCHEGRSVLVGALMARWRHRSRGCILRILEADGTSN